MPRPSKLTPEQWGIIERRLIEGETARSLGREFGVSANAIIKRFGKVHSIGSQSSQVQLTAHKLAEANAALEALPPAHRPVAISLAEKLRSISDSLSSAADLGAKTAYRLNALANSEVAKVDDADPLQSLEALRGVGVLSKLANDSAAIALNLLAANKETVVKVNTEQPKPAALPAAKLSTETLREIVAARNAAA